MNISEIMIASSLIYVNKRIIGGIVEEIVWLLGIFSDFL